MLEMAVGSPTRPYRPTHENQIDTLGRLPVQPCPAFVLAPRIRETGSDVVGHENTDPRRRCDGGNSRNPIDSATSDDLGSMA